MFISVADRSADGSRWLTKCEDCGVSLDWVTSLELTAMAVRGIRNVCFDCDPTSDCAPECFRVDGCLADYVIIPFMSSLYCVDLDTGETSRVAAFDDCGRPMKLVSPVIACPVVHISANQKKAGSGDE